MGTKRGKKRAKSVGKEKKHLKMPSFVHVLLWWCKCLCTWYHNRKVTLSPPIYLLDWSFKIFSPMLEGAPKFQRQPKRGSEHSIKYLFMSSTPLPSNNEWPVPKCYCQHPRIIVGVRVVFVQWIQWIVFINSAFWFGNFSLHVPNWVDCRLAPSLFRHL